MNHIFIICVLCFCVSACKEQEIWNPKAWKQKIFGQENNTATPSKEQNTQKPILKKKPSPVNIDALYTHGRLSFRKARKMHGELIKAVRAFIKNPNTNNLIHCQNAWKKSVVADGEQTYFYHLAQQAANISARFNNLQFRVSARPIQPGYLDSFKEYRYSGLVHDIGLALTEESLEEQHGRTHIQELVLGLYAIEYLIFGENNSRKPEDFFSVSTLKAEHTKQGLKHIDEIATNRRRALLSLQVDVLAKDLKSLNRLWEKSINNSWLARLSNEDTEIQNMMYIQTLEYVLTQHLVELTATVTTFQNKAEKEKEKEKEKDKEKNKNKDGNVALADTQRLRSQLLALSPIVKSILGPNEVIMVSSSLNNAAEAISLDVLKDADFATQKKQISKAYQQLKSALDKTSSLILF